MTPDFNLCDICGARVDKSLTLFVVTDRQRDPSGNGYEAVGENVDLCPTHAVQMLNAFLHPKQPRIYDEERGQFLMEKINAAKKAVSNKS